MKYVRAELIKIFKKPFIWTMSSIYTIIFVVIFYQYTLNTEANVIEPLLKNPENMYSFLVLLFTTILNIIFSALLGGQVVSEEYRSNTISCMIQNTGRYKCYFAKIGILLIISCIFTIFLICIGIFLPYIVFGVFKGISIVGICRRFIICVTATFLISLFSMTLASIVKNVLASNLICIVSLLATQFLPYNLSKYLNYINPYFYLSRFVDSAFGNLKELSFIKIGTMNSMSMSKNATLLCVYCIICVVIQIGIYKKREY